MSAGLSRSIHWLETTSLRAGIDLETGSLVGLERPDSGWRILDRPHLGRSFLLMLPLEGRRNNIVDGRIQDQPSCDVSTDGLSVRSHWRQLRSEHGGMHPVAVTTTVAAREGRLVFQFKLENESDLWVENVTFPFLGDVRPPYPDSRFEAFTNWFHGTSQRSRLWPIFDNTVGYFGFDHPTFLPDLEFGSAVVPVSPFALLQDGQQGLYLGVDEPSAELVSWFGRLVPGWMDSLEGRAAPTTTLAGVDAAIEFAAAHLPYVGPGGSRELTPIMLAAFDGDWHGGADLYRERRRAWSLPTATAPPWAREPHSWLQIHMNSPEDELRWTFDELPAIAEECRQAGVTAIQLVGWNDGGQDQNNPSHDADPRLGGPDALRRAIAACSNIGVRVILFTKFTWADRATGRFRDELISQAVKDPYGDHYQYEGYRYQTVTQMLDINTKRLVPMCFLEATYLQVCEEEFAKVLATGCDGMLFDEAMHHIPALLCFDREHTHRYAAPVYANDCGFVTRLRALGDACDPEFLYAGQGLYDWQFTSYDLSYVRTEDPKHVPLSRYLRPAAILMTAITGFDDRNMINQCLLYRYVISYEPYNFKGRLPDFPDTVAYGRRMDALRTELRRWLWDGEFLDTLGASVTGADGSVYHPYSVFRAEDGTSAVVVANYHPDAFRTVRVSIDGVDDSPVYRLVDRPSWRYGGAGIRIPPRSAAVVLPPDSLSNVDASSPWTAREELQHASRDS